jgi:hypothetical protein
VGWRNGPWVRPASLWLDAPPVGRGLRFVSSCLAPAGRRSDRVLSTAFTGRYHFGPERPFLSAPVGATIRLGAAEVRLLPAGVGPGAAQLHFQSDDGVLLYTVGCRLSGTALAVPARFEVADVWVLRVDAAPGDGPPWPDWLDALAETLRGGAVSSLRVAEPWLAVELVAGLSGRLDVAPGLDVTARRLVRWTRAEGPVPVVGGGPRIFLDATAADAVVLAGDGGETSVPVPAAPTLRELRAAARTIGAREVLLVGAAAAPWAAALAGAGLPARVLGESPRRLL